MSDSDQRIGWKLSTKRGRGSHPAGQRQDRSPSKITRLFRGVSDSSGTGAGPSTSTNTTSQAPSETRNQFNENLFTQDSRRNAVILDVTPQDLRPPSRASVADTISTSRFSLVSPPSPPPDYYKSDSSQSHSFDTLLRSSSRKLLPKLRDHLSSTSKHQKLFTLRKKQRGVPYQADGEPLDGEEGELIDDEACYMDPFILRGMDVLLMLPDEISTYILLFLELPDILACLRVSRHWQRLANDNIIWRNLYFRAGFAVDGHNVRQAMRLSQHDSTTQVPVTPVTPTSPPLSTLSKIAYYLPSYSSSLRASTSSFGTHNSLESNLQIVRHDPVVTSAPLSLDWKNMYKTRREIEKRLDGAEPTRSTLSEHKDAVYCVEYDGDKIVTGSRDKTICVWTIKDGKPKVKMTLKGHSASVLCLQFDHTGTMVSGSSDCSVIVWNLNAEPDKHIVEVLTVHTGGVLDIKMDAKWIVSCSKDSSICVWDRARRNLYKTLYGHDGPVNAIGLQGDQVASVSGDGKMILWDIHSGERIRAFEGHERGLACVVFKGDLLISGSNDKKIKVWDARTGECLKNLVGHEHLVRSLSFDLGTMRLVSASYDRRIRMWDVRTGKYREFANAHDSHIFDVVLRVSKIISASHDGKVLVMDFAPDMDTSLFA